MDSTSASWGALALAALGIIGFVVRSITIFIIKIVTDTIERTAGQAERVNTKYIDHLTAQNELANKERELNSKERLAWHESIDSYGVLIKQMENLGLKLDKMIALQEKMVEAMDHKEV